VKGGCGHEQRQQERASDEEPSVRVHDIPPDARVARVIEENGETRWMEQRLAGRFRGA
jgi:hypothetical protein